MSIQDILIIISFAYLVTNITVVIETASEGRFLPNTPRDVYNDVKVNWFGAAAVYLLLVAVFPIYYFGLLIKFIFTVGRPNKIK